MAANGKVLAAHNDDGRLKTGLYVRAPNKLKLRDRRVQRLTRKMYNAMPWLQLSDMPTARGWARLELMIDTVYGILHTIGPMNGQAEPRRLLGEWRQLQQAQLAFARELGMTPAARMAMKANGSRAALDLAAAMAAPEDAEEVGG